MVDVIINGVALGVSLAMDAFSVSLANGLPYSGIYLAHSASDISRQKCDRPRQFAYDVRKKLRSVEGGI